MVSEVTTRYVFLGISRRSACSWYKAVPRWPQPEPGSHGLGFRGLGFRGLGFRVEGERFTQP